MNLCDKCKTANAQATISTEHEDRFGYHADAVRTVTRARTLCLECLEMFELWIGQRWPEDAIRLETKNLRADLEREKTDHAYTKRQVEYCHANRKPPTLRDVVREWFGK